MNNEIQNLLYCPNSKEKLSLKDDELYSHSTSYPVFDGIPWLFKEPEFSFLEWGTKIQSYIKEEDIHIKHLQNMINLNDNKLTRKRLTQIHDAKSKNLKTMIKTLDIFKGHQQVPLKPSTQQIHSYFQLIFRDWSWESTENDEYFNFVESNITPNIKKVLILGCGAGRLSYDLSNKFPNTNFISMDHNPFLLFTAQKIFNGEEVKLSDYSNFPKNIDATSKNYKIKVDATRKDNHQFILGSFPDLPFQENTFDLIVAPWFFDIIDTSYFPSIKHSLNYLKDDGLFLMYGPNNVHKNHLLEQYSSEEVHEHLAPFFDKTDMEKKSLPYLNNPLNSQNRIEEVMFFKAKSPIKEKSSLKTPSKVNSIQFDAMFEQHKAVNQTFFNIFKHIDKDMTTQELGKKIQAEFGFNESEAYFYAENFISKVMMDMGKS